jgi:Uma2 family endonuclease
LPKPQFTLRADRARIPDVAWVSESRLGLIPRANQAIPIAPDLAVEIISDPETPEETEQRLRDYLEADAEVWQVFPSLSGITVWRGNEGIRLANDEVLASERLPGFLSLS